MRHTRTHVTQSTRHTMILFMKDAGGRRPPVVTYRISKNKEDTEALTKERHHFLRNKLLYATKKKERDKGKEEEAWPIWWHQKEKQNEKIRNLGLVSRLRTPRAPRVRHLPGPNPRILKGPTHQKFDFSGKGLNTPSDAGTRMITSNRTHPNCS